MARISVRRRHRLHQPPAYGCRVSVSLSFWYAAAAAEKVVLSLLPLFRSSLSSSPYTFCAWRRPRLDPPPGPLARSAATAVAVASVAAAPGRVHREHARLGTFLGTFLGTRLGDAPESVGFRGGGGGECRGGRPPWTRGATATPRGEASSHPGR